MSVTLLNSLGKASGNKVAASTSNSRRSQRVVIDFPVTLFGQSVNGKIFEEKTNTLSVSAHGALITLKEDVDSKKPVLLSNPKTQIEIQCRVVHRKQNQKGQFEIGLEFSKPVAKFWRINFPPEDWNPSERKKAVSLHSHNSPTTKANNEK